MPAQVQIVWDKLRTSIWPVPVVMIGLALVLRWVASLIDSAVDDQYVLQIWWLSSGSGDDARNLLSTIVPALITMASVMFSITMVVLSLAASQFGSRLVRTYMTDIRTKFAIGIFLMSIVYCLLVLRTVYSQMPPSEVPHIAVTLGVVLSFGCMLTLVFFLNALARSMVADDVIRRVAAELEASIAKLPQLEDAPSELEGDRPTLANMNDTVIMTSPHEGYVQSIDYDALAELAGENDLRLQLHCKAGAFMCREGWLVSVHPGQALTADVKIEISRTIKVGQRRTPTQDVEFPIRHLVDIALRALSPGINDSNTATVVVDRLRGALSRLMGRHIPRTVRRDREGVARVFGVDTEYGDILDEAFNQIRQAAAPQPSVIIHMIGAIDRIAEHVQREDQRDPLLHHLSLIAAAGTRKAEDDRDRGDIEQRRAAAERKLREALSPQSALVSGAPVGA